MNISLANAIEKGEAASLPEDNIEKAIGRGGGGVEGEQYESILYEGYGPAGVAIIVDVLTDNKNRSAAEVRNIFSKHGGQLAPAGRRRVGLRAPWIDRRRRRQVRGGRHHGCGHRRRGRRRRAGRR